jgi:diguanylate cyclase (GGDEF)-like protein/PAS domain S-box-containing protein
MLIELLIMMLIEGILRTIQNDEPLIRKAFEFIDPILLTIIVSPALYFLIFKPMRAQQDELLRSHGQLRDANSVLEQRVLERTHELLATQEELTQKLQELRIAAVAFNTQEAILITDADANIVRVNQSFQEITGYSAEEVIGRNPRILNSGRHDKLFYEAIWDALRRERKWSGEIWNKRKNGEIYPEWAMITAIYTPDGKLTNYVGSFSDISLRKKTEEEIHLLAFYDPLTRLPNRRLLTDRLQKALIASARHGWRGALLFLDLDNFKILNDTKGHNFGDAMLVEVACRLRNCVRGEDTVARLGGDEFVVLLENLGLDNQEAAARAETAGGRMLVSLAQTYILNSYEHHASVSIGAIIFQGNAAAAEDLLKHADVAMYQAKSAGRNTLRFFDPSMQLALEARSAIEVDLHRALADGQFKLFYQAQVDVAGRLIGAEALIRWIHPQHGLISPLKFIPLAEETGLILPIGLWVLDAACAQLKQWESTPLTRDLQLAVNVSARQFYQKDFVEQVHRVVGKSAIKPELLKLELTESLILDNVADAISKMRELKAIGIRFSMDDFGTGYSSLSYLKQLPLDQLKIDQSFVRDIVTDQNDAVIVQTIIVMAQNFHLNVIAEGVETKEQFEQLQQYGCQVFQGYLFGKPVPIEQFEMLLRQV